MKTGRKFRSFKVKVFLISEKAGKEKDGTKVKSLSDSESDDGKSKKKRDSALPRCFASGLDPEQITVLHTAVDN